jgi:hypothetical protein
VPFFVVCAVLAYHENAAVRLALHAAAALLSGTAAFMTAWRGRRNPPQLTR